MASMEVQIAELTRRMADLESSPMNSPEAEAVRADVLSRLEAFMDQAESEFFPGQPSLERKGSDEGVPGQPSIEHKGGSTHSDSTLRKVFDLHDTDSSGFLEKDEVVALAQKLGAEKEVDELRTAILELDTNGDGKVSFDEFAAFMRKEETSGKIAKKLRAKLLKGKLGRQLSRMKSAVESAAAASGPDGPRGSERKFDVTVCVGRLQPDEAAAMEFEGVVQATPRAELPEGEWDQWARFTLAMRPGVSEEAVAGCIRNMEGLYNMMVDSDDVSLKLFDAQPVGVTLVVTIKVDPEEMARQFDKLVFFHGKSPGCSLRATGKLRSSVDPDRLLAATFEEPYDLSQSAKAAMQVVATVSHDAWFEDIVRMTQRAGEDSDDEPAQRPSAEDFDNLSFSKKFQYRVLPKLTRWLGGARAKFNFASLSELLDVAAVKGHKNFRILKAWTADLARYHLAKMLGEGEPPPEDPYRAITAVVGGISRAEFMLRCAHGDIEGSVDMVGFACALHILPAYELCQAAANDELERPPIPTIADE